ncbi:MAG: hypothetical protein ABL986_07515 [Vicinamibacterales bacterium]
MAKRSGTSTVLKKQRKKPVRLITKARLLEYAETQADRGARKTGAK